MYVKQIMIHKLSLGMTVAEDIYSNGKQFLLPKGTIIDDDSLKILRNSDLISVPILREEEFKKAKTSVNLNQISHAEKLKHSEEFLVFEEKYEKKTEEFSLTLNEIAHKDEKVNVDELFAIASDVMDGHSNTYHLMDILSNIRGYDDSTYAHSLNVAMLSNVLGRWIHLPDDDLKMLTVAGMLHDIGKVLLPPEIIKKPGRLTNEEFEIVKSHPKKGAELLQAKGVDDMICQVALRHHEKCDGSGYPSGLKGEEIDQMAKLVAIVDVYGNVGAVVLRGLAHLHHPVRASDKRKRNDAVV